MSDDRLLYEDETVELSGTPVSRRDFLKVAGTGLFVFVVVDPLSALQAPARGASRPSYPTDFNAYIHVATGGKVTGLVGKVELGQGSRTALAQLLAEELDVDMDSITMVMGDTDLCPWDMGTFGSLTIRQFGPVLKAAAAEARAVLLQLAAERLGTGASQLKVRNGVVSAPNGRSVSYGELVAGKRIERHVVNAAAKDVAGYGVVGTSPRRKDALEKLTGGAKYAGDMLFPGMLHARLLRPPAHGMKLKTVDTAAAEQIQGVRVVRDGDLVAVLHASPDVADRALTLLKAEFEGRGIPVDDKTIFDHIVKAAPQPEVVAESGNLADGEKLASQITERTYVNSYVAHSPLETHSATAKFEDSQLTVWAGTQTPFGVKQQVAQALGLPAGKVRVITPYVGGGFGGKSASRQATEAARLAKITGAPVQVVWRRPEEFFFDAFRPAAVVKIRSGVDGKGKLVLWDFAVYCAGDREAKQFYDIPHQRTVAAGGWHDDTPGLHPFAIGPWRAPSVNTNTFARESQIDVVASALGRDPLEFRMANLTDARMRRVLEAASRQFDWKPGKAPSGRGVGVACAIYIGTYVATMAEVAVDRKSGRVQVKRVVCAQDQGVTVSPDGSRQQIEGSIMMGLGYALTEEVHFRNGEVLERNFDTYEIPRFSWLPKIETVLIDNPQTAASGCGEPPIVTMGAVIANAIFDACGARVLQLPMTPERILAALKPL